MWSRWPSQLPCRALSVAPTRAVPRTVGGVRFTGGLGAGATTAVGADLTDNVPALLRPVTSSTIVAPTRSFAMTYEPAVAPGIAVQTLPARSQRSQ